MVTNDKYFIAFASIDDISSNFIGKLYKHFNGDIKKAWESDEARLKEIEGLQRRSVQKFLASRDKTDIDKAFNYILENNINYLTIENENYPKLLKEINDPPLNLFYLGDLTRCNFDKCLAVVGSRNASNSSKKVLKNIMSELKQTDLCIVSGLALGADTQAHMCAIENNLSTIAVIGGGFNNLYPQQNKELFKDIVNKYGVVMSESWPDFEPIAWRFPHRNRIVNGLSKGTLVIEAKLKSGAIITANMCLDEGRELMCIPGDILNPNTEGVYHLLKNGATMVTCANDILDALNWNMPTKKKQEITNLNLNDYEQKIYEYVAVNNPNFDDIMIKTSLSSDEILLHLTTLELKGLIKQVEGSRYTVT